ncbi:Glycosyl hydrolase family 98 putative carbohydrate binding module [Ruminiclostridium papyrosolvens DSM 2782]|uniref:Glycosyl hydrolase family 98 putative carbohydrate binding module n=1 Tax=Ruminiclostridium papyrosolvens DSM 2782 TaxID=588581 RepID=F1TBV9_9FIRM|nr:NPCBM/NEW2 domain-containing protein [Ruminiclostridium papyrosolvens]EGD48130.1 Glycosyl hydrolase family 98 putative carbohydrate binding module [Ruminiclostridium papyrosolvens DSM 2782]WES34987.1 NPCBM/NEW2 domain-containing protein [Ruminiclostridium papyrosolvens DSM 2782]
MRKKFKLVLSVLLSLVIAVVFQMKMVVPANATVMDYSYFLSDYPYNSSLTTAAFNPIRMDQSFNANSIRLNGNTYAKGIGTHANSTIVYDLKQNFNTFTAYVGVDNEVGSGNGSVKFIVKVDGVQKYQSPTLTASSTAQKVMVDITGAGKLELIADTADGSTSNDHADWAEAKVTKTHPSSTLTLTADTSIADSIDLQSKFQWAKDKALSYVRTANKFDYIPSYFAAMTDDGTNSQGQFCARDVAHYMEGAHLLGLDLENFSMMKVFATGANGRVGQQTTDYYWPRWWYNYNLKNLDGTPNEDFRSSQWRTLPTAFDMIWRSYEQYLWTGDNKWINDTEMSNFYTNINTNFMNSQGKNTDGAATETTQLASYYEFPNPSEHFVVAGDSIGCQYQSLLAYANILTWKGLTAESQTYKAKADSLRSNFEAHWFDSTNNRYVRGFGPGKVTGTQFGTSGSFGNDSSTTSDKATDGNINTWSDSANANGAYTGIDLGAGNEKRIYKIRYYPRNGWASRMLGGRFQGSNTSQTAGYVDLHTITTMPASGIFTEATVSDTTQYRYLRYVSPDGGYCNVAELEFYSPSVVPNTSTDSLIGPVKLGGTQFGTSGSYGDDPVATSDKATDGNINTFMDSAIANGAFTGIDLGAGNASSVSKITYYPRNGWASRMVGGKFQGSNTSQTSGFVDLYTIGTTPAADTWTTVEVSNPTAYRYLRYLSPDGGYCNVTEIGFYTSTGKNFRSDWGHENSFFMPMTLITDNASRTDTYLEYIKNSVDSMETSGNSLNIEAKTYLPETFYKHGKNEYGWKYLKQILDSNATYPEVPFVCIGSTISGLMGVTPDAPNNTVRTLPQLPAATKIPWVEANHIKVGSNDLKIRHDGNTQTTLTNNAGGSITWKACFDGRISKLYINGLAKNAVQETSNGRPISSVNVSVSSGKAVTVKTTP